MNKIVLIEDNQRLDKVVYDYYGDLMMFDAVLEANTHITDTILTKGVTLTMPEQAATVEEDKLW